MTDSRAVTTLTIPLSAATRRAPDLQRRENRPAAVIGVTGLVVLVVLVQNSGGVPIQLFGSDLVLVLGGFLVTRRLLVGFRSGSRWTRMWAREQFRVRSPPLLFVLAAVPVLAVLWGRSGQADQAALDAVAGLLAVGNLWELVQAGVLGPFPGIDVPPDWYLDRPALVDPLGMLGLLGLLVQLTLGWAVVVAVLRVLTRRQVPMAVVIMSLAALACVVAALPADAVGVLAPVWQIVRPHTWLAGAAAAAVAYAGHDHRRATTTAARSGAAAAATVSAAVGVALVAAAVVLAAGGVTVPGLPRPEWSVLVALGAAVLLLAADAPSATGLHELLGRGPLAELGRSAYPLLVLHLPVSFALQLVFPAVRPLALLVVGGGISWMLGLLLHDGIGHRLLGRSGMIRSTVAAGGAVAAVAVAVAVVSSSGAALGDLANPGARPTVLVLGGSGASDIAAALRDHGTRRFAVTDGSVPGCGLLPAAAPASSGAVVAWRARWPERTAADCDPPGRVEAATPVAAAVIVELGDDLVPARAGDPCSAAFRSDYRTALEAAVPTWTARAGSGPVLLATARPGAGTAGAARGRCVDALLDEVVAREKQVVPLDVGEFVCPAGTCRAQTVDGAELREDDLHLTRAGLIELAGWLESSVTEHVR